AHHAFAQAVQFKARLVAREPAGSDTLYLGVSGDGAGPLRDNTIGVDNNPAFGIFQESAAPPTPPTNPFDARFLTIPGRDPTYPVGLGGGTFRDFRDFRSPAQVDSFRIKIEGDDLKTGRAVVSWSAAVLRQCAPAWTIKALSGGTPFPETDMLGTDSVSIPPDGLTTRYDLLIIKNGAINGPTGVPGARAPATYSLEQNFPNPFNPSTEIRFSLSRGGMTNLRVYNLLGQQVADLVSGYRPAGPYSVEFNASRLATGAYFYRLQSGTFSALKRMIYLK
ncbi:MAG TPA: T9SS type A sorting domain-containing protein, partial [Bacteroidota bacterium]|nr:T9SS type A sorting domain-containing protein [Bacteroidota bacterium]